MYSKGWGRTSDRALIALNSDDQALGAVWYRLFDENNKGYGYIDNCTPELGIAVSKDVRGQGIGSILMKSIMEQAMEDGYKSISLSVNPTNRYAVNMYRKLGFEECGGLGTSITMIYEFSRK